MMIKNDWQEYGVNDRTISLLCKWIEARSKIIKSPYLPIHSERYLIEKKYNKHGKAIYYMNILEGLDFSRETKPKIHSTIDEFTYIFYTLDHNDRIIILSYIDPFDEFTDRRSWINYLKEFGINKCEERLILAMVNLQKETEKRLMFPSLSTDDDLWTWNSIAKFIEVSIPTAIKMAKFDFLPVTIIAGRAYSTKSKLKKYMKERIDNTPYSKIKKIPGDRKR